MGSVGGGDAAMLLDETVYFVASKKYLPIKANSRVADKKMDYNNMNGKNVQTQTSIVKC